MVWVTAGNPVAMLPDSLTVKRALETRELTVAVDAFLTDTARAAHLVLPTTTMLEDDDLVGAYGHHWLGEVRPVVPAPDGVKTDYAIAKSLAERLGLAEHFTADAETWKRRFLNKVSDQGASLEAIRDGYVRNPLAPKVLFADRKFKTASGRVNLIHEADPEPARPTADRPLLLMAFSTERAQSSQWAHPNRQGRARRRDASSRLRGGLRGRRDRADRVGHRLDGRAAQVRRAAAPGRDLDGEGRVAA